MDVAKPSLRDLLDKQQVLNIPLFQRSYAWRRKNWDALLSDVTSLDDGHSHFMGALVFAPERAGVGRLPIYQVIDGQQRMSTLSIMLCALRDLASEFGDSDTVSEIKDYLCNKRGTNTSDLRYKVRPRYRDRGDYIALVDGTKPPGQSAMPQAYSFFHRGFADELKNGNLNCQYILAPMMDNLRFVSITMERGENHYEIFRALNFLGVDLRVGDLIRNYVFMSIPGREQENFDQNHWTKLEERFSVDGKVDGPEFEKFFRYALRRKGEYFRDSDAYLKFEETHPENQIKENPKMLVDEYGKMAAFWVQIKGGNLPDPALPEGKGINDALQRVGGGELDIQVARPLMMRLLELRDTKGLPDGEVAEAFRLISGFFLRRHVCGMNSRGYAKWFCEMCGNLDNNPLENLRAFLAQRPDGWPDDASFEAKFLTFNLYSSVYCGAVIRRIERELERQNGHLQVPVKLGECWVEHVMPQTLTEGWKDHMGEDAAHHAEWLHTPGNLTLLGKECNREISNDLFDRKLSKCLRPSILRLNDDFNNCENEWRIEQIRQRGMKLAKIAARIWPAQEG